MRRQSLKRIIAEQPRGHIYYKPRHVSVQAYSSNPRKTNTDEDQEVVEMGSRETGNPSNAFVDSGSGRNKGFPDSSRSDRSVKTHGHNNPKVDSRPVETENEKGSATSQRQLEGSKREAGIVWKEDQKMPDGGYWTYDPNKKTDPEFEMEREFAVEDKSGLEGIRELEDEYPGYLEKEISLEYSDLLNRLKSGEDISLKQEALHLCIDERLRGNINHIVESFDDLSWDDIDSISYQSMGEVESLEDWPRTIQKDGVLIYHADTPERQAQGLQYVKENDFPKNAVMLFKNVSGPFHMHNCKFPIDIIFTDDDFRVLSVSNMIPEGGYTYPPMGTKHAIETHPDWAIKNKIGLGTVLFRDGFGISVKSIKSLIALKKNLASDEEEDVSEEALQDPTLFFSDVVDPISVENVISKLEGVEQQQVKDLIEEYANRFPELNIQDMRDIFGYWEGQPENTLGVNVSGDLDKIKKLAAHMGLNYNQKAVAIFVPTKEESEGKYLSINFDVPKDPNNLNLLNKLIGHTPEQLDYSEKPGIGGASFSYEKEKGITGMELFLYNDQNNAKVIRQLSTILNEEGVGYKPSMENSKAIFIGDDDREKAQKIFEDIINE